MAIIYSYPPVASLQTTDLFIISRVPTDPDEISNFSVSMSSVADYIIDRFIDPNATDFQIPVFNQGGNRITGSIMSQDSSPSNGVAGTKITIAGDLTLERDQSDTTLTLISDGSNPTPGGEQHNPSIKFIQDGGAQNAAIGFNIIDDTGGGTIPGTGNRFWIVNAMDDVIGGGGITFGTAQVDGWDNAIGRFIIRGDGKGLFGHPDSLYSKTLGSQFEIYDNRDENTTTDPSFSVYSVVDYAAPSGNEGAGGIKQILDVYNNGVFEGQEAMMLIPGTNSSDFAASTPIAFYTNSDMDTVGPSGFAGKIFNSGNWLLDGSGTPTNTDPGYQLKVAGTGLFTDQVTIPLTPVANTDAASKGYVDAIDLSFIGNTGTGTVTQSDVFNIVGVGPITTFASGNTLQINSSAAEGTGTTNALPVWSDGPNGVLGDSSITQILDAGGNVKEVNITTTSGQGADFKVNGAGSKVSLISGTSGNDIFLLTEDNTGFYSGSFQMRGNLAVGRSTQPINSSLDVGSPSSGIPAAWFRNGVVISNNPSGVQVDNTSMVIGAGSNDNVSGSDHCLIVGSGNQITSNSDQSVAFGQGNTITGSTDATAAGNQNIITTSARSLALGSQNQITNATSSFVAGGDNTVPNGATNMLLGYQNTAGSGSSNYILGNVITGTSQAMTLGFRNDTAGYPTTNKNLGLGDTKFVVAVGSNTTTNANALIITEGGINGGSSGTVPQVPRVILPTVVNFNFVDDAAAAAGGIPVGGLYHNAGVIRIRLT